MTDGVGGGVVNACGIVWEDSDEGEERRKEPDISSRHSSLPVVELDGDEAATLMERPGKN